MVRKSGRGVGADDERTSRLMFLDPPEMDAEATAAAAGWTRKILINIVCTTIGRTTAFQTVQCSNYKHHDNLVRNDICTYLRIGALLANSVVFSLPKKRILSSIPSQNALVKIERIAVYHEHDDLG